MIDVPSFSMHLEAMLRTSRQVREFRDGRPTGKGWTMSGSPSGFVLESCSIEAGEQVRLEFVLEGESRSAKRLVVEIPVRLVEQRWAKRTSDNREFAQDVYVLLEEVVEQGARRRLLESTETELTIRLASSA